MSLWREWRMEKGQTGEGWEIGHTPAAAAAVGAAGRWPAAEVAAASAAAAAAARQRAPGGTGSGILSGSSWDSANNRNRGNQRPARAR